MYPYTLPKSENAQTLYLYLASLTKDPIPVTLSRMRQRMSSTGAVKDVNARIKKAIKKLEDVGYLQGRWIKFQGEQAYLIYERAKKIGSPA